MMHRSDRLITYTVDSRRQPAGHCLDSAGSTRRYAPITVEQAREAIADYDARQAARRRPAPDPRKLRRHERIVLRPL